MRTALELHDDVIELVGSELAARVLPQAVQHLHGRFFGKRRNLG